MPWNDLVVVATVVALASTTQTVAGFGFALIAVPLMSLAIDTKEAVAVAAVLGLANASIQAVQDRVHVERILARRLFAWAVVGMPLGLVVLLTIDSDVLRLLLGGTVLVLTALLARGVDVSGSGPGPDRLAGFASGVLQTSLSTNGPPLAIVLHGRRLDPHTFRATLLTDLALIGIVGVGLFALTGRITADVLVALVVGAPALLIGSAAGRTLRPRVDGARFRRLVLALLALSGTAAIAASAAGR